MERKISEQNRLIKELYDDLESRDKFIDKLQEDLKDTLRQSAKTKKQWEAEKKEIKGELEKKRKID